MDELIQDIARKARAKIERDMPEQRFVGSMKVTMCRRVGMGEDEYDWSNEPCWQCGGEGYVYNCFEEYACIDPESGCDLCMRRCDICRPSKPNPELQAVLSDALAKLNPQQDTPDA